MNVGPSTLFCRKNYDFSIKSKPSVCFIFCLGDNIDISFWHEIASHHLSMEFQSVHEIVYHIPVQNDLVSIEGGLNALIFAMETVRNRVDCEYHFILYLHFTDKCDGKSEDIIAESILKNIPSDSKGIIIMDTLPLSTNNALIRAIEKENARIILLHRCEDSSSTRLIAIVHMLISQAQFPLTYLKSFIKYVILKNTKPFRYIVLNHVSVEEESLSNYI